MHAKKENIYSAYVSKNNSNLENKFILLMIPKGEKWHYLAVKEILALLRGTTSKSNEDLYCLNCLHFVEQKKNLNHTKKYVKIKIIVM